MANHMVTYTGEMGFDVITHATKDDPRELHQLEEIERAKAKRRKAKERNSLKKKGKLSKKRPFQETIS